MSNKGFNNVVDQKIYKQLCLYIDNIDNTEGFDYLCIDVGNTIELSKKFEYTDLIGFIFSKYFNHKVKLYNKNYEDELNKYKEWSGILFKCDNIASMVDIVKKLLVFGPKGPLHFRNLDHYSIVDKCLRLGFYK